VIRIVFLSGLLLSFAACGNSRSRESSLTGRPVLQKDGGSGRTLTEPFMPSIPEGTNVKVRLLQTITSRWATAGDQFEAELLAPIVIAGKVMFPRSTRLRGHIAESRRCSKTNSQGFLRITLDAIQKLDGGWVDMDATSISARGEGRGITWLHLPRRRPSLGRPDAESIPLSEAIISSDRKLQFAVLQEMVMSR